MRFTRPGARPDQPPPTGEEPRLGDTLEGTKLRGRVLGPRVEDEGARSKLGAGEVLELVARPVRRIELDVEVMVPASAARGLLVHRHYVRQRLLEKPVVFLQQPLQAACE